MLGKFWQAHSTPGFHPEDRPHIPADQVIAWSPSEALGRTSEFERRRDLHSKIHENLFPQPFAGSLENASIFILYGNPGFSISDYQDDHHNPAFAEVCEENLRGSLGSLVWLHPHAEKSGAGRYWRSRFRKLGEAISVKTKESHEASLRRIAKSVTLIEAGAYHSRRSPGDWIFQLPSSKAAKTFVRSILVPKAKSGKCLLFAWRRASFWVGETNISKILIRQPKQAQGSYFFKNEHRTLLRTILAQL